LAKLLGGMGAKQMASNLIKKIEQINQLRISEEGKYRVIGLDTYDLSDWIEDEFDTKIKALEFYNVKIKALELSYEKRKKYFGENTSGINLYGSCEYYVYAPNGDRVDNEELF